MIQYKGVTGRRPSARRGIVFAVDGQQYEVGSVNEFTQIIDRERRNK